MPANQALPATKHGRQSRLENSGTQTTRKAAGFTCPPVVWRSAHPLGSTNNLGCICTFMIVF
ncbi:MAG: hypothetical protein ABR936_16040 [Bacteroidota bacterium]